MDLTTRLARGVKATFVADVVSTLASAAALILLARYLLGPAGYGLLTFAVSVLGVAGIFGTLGLPKSTARYVTEYAEGDSGQVRHVLRIGALAMLALVTVVGAVLTLGNGILARALDEPALAPFLVVGALYVGFSALNGYLTSVFQGFNRVEWSALVRVVDSVVRLLAVVGFVLLGLGALGAFLGYVAGYVAAGLVGLYVLYTRIVPKLTAATEREGGLRRRVLEYSVPLTATRGANVLDKKVDVILVGMLLNTTAVGFYAIAKQVSDFVSMPAASLGFTISPALAEQRDGDRLDTAARIYEESLSYVLLLYVPACVGLVLVAGPMIRYVFGTDYLPAVPVVQVYSGFIFVNAVDKVTTDGLDYLGRARSRALIKGTMAVANFVLNLLLIPAMGVVGAALATVITYSVYTSSNVYFIHQELGFRVRRVARHAAGTCLLTAGMFAAVAVLLPHVGGLVTLLGVVLSGATVFAGLVLACGHVDARRVASLLR
ncbi:flippase [Halorarum halophilum]|uniref:Flippase n=1 Tax=Halorarum halophilum TaxID=2743090 RepID=A0A7D5H0A4_9EURY|nr:flippase [Halobaculum halophilum]QLG27913.1 flippase [Halobaculum halophilum]